MPSLPRGQQYFLQRLLASHVLSDKEAKVLFENLQEYDVGQDYGCDTLEKCFKAINKRLTHDFSLEITSIILDRKKYHAIINQHVDNVSKQSFLHKYNPHQRAFIKQMFETIIDSSAVVTDDEDDDEEGEKNTSSSQQEKNYTSTRMDLINARNSLKEPYKMDIKGSEDLLDQLIAEKWLVGPESEDRRDSMKASISFGPRTYLELSHLLTDFGYDQENLPQFIFHR